MIALIQSGVLTAATLVLFALQGWAFVDAVSHKAETYVAAEKQTKPLWLVILGVALAAHMLIWHPIHLLNIIGAVAAIVYRVDLRPQLRMYSRR